MTPSPRTTVPHAPAQLAPLAVLLASMWLGPSAGATAAPAGELPAVSDVLAPDAAARWPRLLFTTTQRAAIVRLRQSGGNETGAAAPDLAAASAHQGPPPVTAFVLHGLTLGPLGSSAWINGLVLRNGEAIGGRTVHIEPQGVRLSQAGQPDIRLKPGQQSPDAAQPTADVVPAGSFLYTK